VEAQLTYQLIQQYLVLVHIVATLLCVLGFFFLQLCDLLLKLIYLIVL
jgi:hypothetical protein